MIRDRITWSSHLLVEAAYFAQVVRRITALILLGPALDASYNAILPTATGLFSSLMHRKFKLSRHVQLVQGGHRRNSLARRQPSQRSRFTVVLSALFTWIKSSFRSEQTMLRPGERRHFRSHNDFLLKASTSTYELRHNYLGTDSRAARIIYGSLIPEFESEIAKDRVLIEISREASSSVATERDNAATGSILGSAPLRSLL